MGNPFLLRKDFNEMVLKATYKAQKKYGFEIGTGEHATWNNDAFCIDNLIKFQFFCNKDIN